VSRQGRASRRSISQFFGVIRVGRQHSVLPANRIIPWCEHSFGTPQAQDPKSAAGTRVVPVCEQLYEILEDHLLRLGRDAGLAFGRSAETPYSYSGVRARAKRAFEKAKLQPSDLQLHECRNSYKSWLEDIGIPDSRIDRYLGHSDPSVQRRYSHQLDHQYLEDAQALTAYLRRAISPTRGDRVRDSRATVRDTS
jgi:integrase